MKAYLQSKKPNLIYKAFFSLSRFELDFPTIAFNDFDNQAPESENGPSLI